MASVDTTSDPSEEGADQLDIDYVELLRVSLKQQKVLYIADIVLEVEEETLDDLMEYTRNDLVEVLRDIHDDENNNHKIKASHRNKFAKTVIQIATRKKNTTEKQKAAPPAASKMKLLIIGKEEEEAIESIQTGQQFMAQNLVKMKEIFNNLNENNKNIKQNLEKICNSLKQQIDTKQKQMISAIDNIYQYHLNKANERNKITQQSAKVVAKFYNDYESYFSNEKMTKLDRKEKLIHAQQSINNEVAKLKKFEDVIYNMVIMLNKNLTNQFFDECLNLRDIGVALPVVQKVETNGNTLCWKAVTIPDDVMKMLPNYNKEENKLCVKYQILYREKTVEHKQEEKKDDIEWNQINNSVDVTKWNMQNYICASYEAKVSYTINNLFQSPASEIGSFVIEIDSVIMNDNEKKILASYLKGFTGYKLLYRGTRDGFGATTYHSKCDGVCGTVTVVLSEHQHVFGGYTPIKIEGSVGECDDPTNKTFVFLLRSQRGNQPNKWNLVTTKGAIHQSAAYLPIFGDNDGYTFVLYDNANSTSNNYSNAQNKSFINLNDKSMLAGSKKFKFLDIEVFHVI